MTVHMITIAMSLSACGTAIDGVLNAQSGAQAQEISEALKKGESARGEGAETTRLALTRLAADLKSGEKVMKDVGKLTAAYAQAVSDGEISREEAAVVQSQISNLSKVRSGR